MIVLDMSADVDKAIDALGGITHRQMPFAVAMALTVTGREAKPVVIAKMGEVFDRPTPYTLNALQLMPATKARLRAELWYKRTADRYLTPEVDGGGRKVKRSERALQAAGILPVGMYTVPGRDAALDAYGNMARGQLGQLLSQLQARRADAYQNETPEARRRRDNRDFRWGLNPLRTFVLRRGGQPIGIFQRRGTYTGFGDSTPLRAVIGFVAKPDYTKRLPLYETVEGVVRKRFNANFITAFNHAMATAKR